MQRRSHYQILEVEKSASLATIKKAYHKKILASHPDRNENKDDDEAKLINEAHEVLSDSKKRAAYDAEQDNLIFVDVGSTCDIEPFVSDKTPLESRKNTDLIKGYFALYYHWVKDDLNKLRRAYLDEIVKRTLSDEQMEKDLLNFQHNDENIYDTLRNNVDYRALTTLKNIYGLLILKSVQIAKELKEDLYEEISKMDEKTRTKCLPDLLSIGNDALKKGEITLVKNNYPQKNHLLVDQINSLSKTISILKKPKEENESAISYHRNRVFPALHFLTVKRGNSTISNVEMIDPPVNSIAHFFKKLIQAITEKLCSTAPFAMAYAYDKRRTDHTMPFSEAHKIHTKYSNRHYNFWKPLSRPNLQSTVCESQNILGLKKL